MSVSARISEPDASAAAASAGMKLRVVYRDGAGEIHLDWPRERIAQAIADRQGTLWVDIENAESASTREAETLLREDFGFHSLAVEDAIDESHLPKIDDWGEYIYLVFHGTSIDPRTDVLRLHELDIFLGLNYVVT
ncbi:MAG: CorA family divalent cation transporter, partial [Isosphaeraceae bacterium]